MIDASSSQVCAPCVTAQLLQFARALPVDEGTGPSWTCTGCRADVLSDKQPPGDVSSRDWKRLHSHARTTADEGNVELLLLRLVLHGHPDSSRIDTKTDISSFILLL